MFVVPQILSSLFGSTLSGVTFVGYNSQALVSAAVSPWKALARDRTTEGQEGRRRQGISPSLSASSFISNKSCISTLALTLRIIMVSDWLREPGLWALLNPCLYPWFLQFSDNSDFLLLLLSVPYSQILYHLYNQFPKLNSFCFPGWTLTDTAHYVPKCVYIGSWYRIHFILRVVIRIVWKPVSMKINLIACNEGFWAHFLGIDGYYMSLETFLFYVKGNRVVG